MLLHALPIFHTHGLFVATNVILLSGASMIFMPKFDPDEIFRFMPRATTMMGVPTFYVRLLQDKRLTPETTKHMRLFIAGSAPLLAETHREWTAATGHAILERYGMTETNMLTSNPYEGERVPGSVGHPLPGVELRIADPETGAPIPDGDVGMIEVKGPNVFKGYWRMPEKTKAEFRDDGFFITGDLGKIGPDGYVYIVGRGKDLVISGGYNVYPKEVETEIDAIPGRHRKRGDRLPAQGFRRGRHRRHRQAAGRDARRARRAEGARRPARQVQAAESRDVRRRAAAQHHGQGAEERAARPLQGYLCDWQNRLRAPHGPVEVCELDGGRWRPPSIRRDGTRPGHWPAFPRDMHEGLDCRRAERGPDTP